MRLTWQLKIKLVNSTETHNGSKWHCVPKDKKYYELHSIKALNFPQRQIHRRVALKPVRNHFGI